MGPASVSAGLRLIQGTSLIVPACPKPSAAPHHGKPHIYPSSALGVFARSPIPGETKTRLIPALGAQGAADFHRALVSDTLGKAVGLKTNVARYLFVAGRWIPATTRSGGYERRAQRGRTLNRRIEEAFAFLLRRHSRAVIIGTDSPMLSPLLLRLALRELRLVDAVLGPCPDGGYYLIGLRRAARGLLNGVRLGTEFAFEDTLTRLLARGFSCAVLEPCGDVDRPEDLLDLRKQLVRSPAMRRVLPAAWRFLSQAHRVKSKLSSARHF